MSEFYKTMPEDFKKAVEVIKQYCQMENCDCADCKHCEYPLGYIRKGDDLAYEECENMDEYYRKGV